MFYSHLQKRRNFCDFLFASIDKEALPLWTLLLLGPFKKCGKKKKKKKKQEDSWSFSSSESIQKNALP